MKKLLLFFGGLFICCAFASAQSPLAIPYQAVVRDSTGTPIPNQHAAARFTVHDSLASGNIVFQERDTFTTSGLGLFNINLGQGSVLSGTFSSINWGTNAKFLQVDIDQTGGTSYITMGTTQILSVPYALYAGSSATPVPSGMVLLGKLIGANMNSAGTYTLQLTGMTGTFYTGELIMGPAYAQVASISDTTMVLSNVQGCFSNQAGAGITGQYGQLTYTLLVDTFLAGEQILDMANYSNGWILTDNGSGTMYIQNVTAGINAGDTIEGQTSGATAVVATYSPPATATIASSSFSGGDQVFTLSGGTTVMATNVIFTNASDSLSNAADPEIWTGASRTGNSILNILPASPLSVRSTMAGSALTYASLSSLLPKSSGLASLGNSSSTYTCSSAYFNTFGGGSLYFSLGTPRFFRHC